MGGRGVEGRRMGQDGLAFYVPTELPADKPARKNPGAKPLRPEIRPQGCGAAGPGPLPHQLPAFPRGLLNSWQVSGG